MTEHPTDKVVFLAFNNPTKAVEDVVTFIACKHCRNKTYTITKDRPDAFNLIKCAACGNTIGRMGWAPEGEDA